MIYHFIFVKGWIAVFWHKAWYKAGLTGGGQTYILVRADTKSFLQFSVIKLAERYYKLVFIKYLIRSIEFLIISISTGAKTKLGSPQIWPVWHLL